MAREQAMFAVSHCRYGVVNQRFKKKCRNGPGLRNGAGTFEEATTLRVQCLMMMPIHQNNSRMASIASGNSLNALNECWIFCFIDCFIFMAGTPSPKRKIRISDDHWRSDWTKFNQQWTHIKVFNQLATNLFSPRKVIYHAQAEFTLTYLHRD